MDKKNPEYRKRSMIWRYRWKEEVLVFCVLLGFAFFINSAVRISGLQLDDLYMWSSFADDTFLQYVFPIGSTRFRVLYNLISYLEFFFVGPHMNWFVPVNIIVNAMIAYTLYRIARRMSGGSLISFVCAVLYLVSRMSYYQIGQVYGLMESLALWAAIGILYCLYLYQNEKESGDETYWAACALYFANCFIHERYMVLLPLFFVALLAKKEKKAWKWLLPLILFALVQLIRLLAIGSILPAGIGGTKVVETFQFRQAVFFVFQQIFHLFGINLGEGWLCPPTWDQTTLWIKLIVLLQDAVIVALVLLFIVKIVTDRKNRSVYLWNSALFIVFIGLCIASSSVTIHLELRWVYVSMTAALLFLTYMCGSIFRRDGQAAPEQWGVPGAGQVHLGSYRMKESHENWTFRRHSLTVGVCLMLLYGTLSLISEIYYRSFYHDLYFWYTQQEYNSLADETWGRYGSDIFGKKIYILKNSYNVSRFYADTFFRTFDKDREAKGTEVIFVDTIRDFGQVTNNMLVLYEDTASHRYQDITSVVRQLKCESIYGYYSDGWMDEKAKVRVMAGSSGRIDMELLYPGSIVGGETMTVWVDGHEAEVIDINQNILYASIETYPYRTVELDFENNFYLEGAQEQRGEDRFAIIVNFTTN